MRFLTEKQIRELEAQALAREIADEAEALVRRARAADCVLEIHSVADLFSVATVRPRANLMAAHGLVVPA